MIDAPMFKINLNLSLHIGTFITKFCFQTPSPFLFFEASLQYTV
jgi:hypothetical protein